MNRLTIASVCCCASLSLLVGCPGDPGADAGPPPPTEEDLVDDIAAFVVRCSPWGSGTFLSEMEPALAAEQRDRLDDEVSAAFREGIDNPNVVVDESLLPACLAWLEQAACGEEPAGGECDGVVKGTIEEGGPCLDDGECTTDYCLRPDAAACGTCTAVRAGGESCRELDLGTGDVVRMRCEEGTFCGPLTGDCEDQLGQGALCTDDGQCQEGHLCIGTPGACERLTEGEAAGDACTVLEDNPTCGVVLRSGLRCTGTETEEGLCVALEVVELDGTCDGRFDRPDGTRWCLEGLTENWCSIPDGADVGVCLARPVAGESCIDSQGRCKNDALCVVSDPGPADPQAECVTSPEAGDACVEDAAGSDGCSTIGNFLTCDDEATPPVCIDTADAAEEAEDPPACEDPGDAGPAADAC